MEEPVPKASVNGTALDGPDKIRVKHEANGSMPGVTPSESPVASAGPDAAAAPDQDQSTIQPLSMTPAALTNGTGAAVALAKPQTAQAQQRVNIDSIMTRIQRRLGKSWEKYRDTITQFLMGKLSRVELVAAVSSFLRPQDVHLHNYLLLSILANSFRDLTPGDDSMLSGWKQSSGSNKPSSDTPTDMLHREILALPARERKRIKNISRDSKKPPTAVPPPVVIATRQAILPKIPYIPDRSNAGSMIRTPTLPNRAASASTRQSSPSLDSRASPAPGGGAGSGTGAGAGAGDIQPAGRSPAPQRAPDDIEHDTVSAMADGQHLHHGRFSGPLMWAQDIIHGLDAQLASESYEVPDDDAVGTRMLGIALENGMIKGLEAGTTDVMLRGLEAYLNTIVAQLLDSVRSREPGPHRPLTAIDLDRFTNFRGVEFHEISAPIYRLKTHFVRDEETAAPLDAMSALLTPAESPNDDQNQKPSTTGNAADEAEGEGEGERNESVDGDQDRDQVQRPDQNQDQNQDQDQDQEMEDIDETAAVLAPLDSYLELVAGTSRLKRSASELAAEESALAGKRLVLDLLGES